MFFDDTIPITLVILSFLFLPFLILRSIRSTKDPSLTPRGSLLVLCVFLVVLVYFESSFQWPRFTLRPPSYFVVSPS